LTRFFHSFFEKHHPDENDGKKSLPFFTGKTDVFFCSAPETYLASDHHMSHDKKKSSISIQPGWLSTGS